MNITDAFYDNARQWPDHPAVESGDRTVTYGELAALADRAAAGLLAAGVAPGDIVALVLPDSPRQIAVILALARIGAILFPINVRTVQDEHVAGLGGHPLKFAVVPNARTAVPAGTTALALAALFETDATVPADRTEAGGAMPLICAQSSGTTGTPKTFQLSHEQVFASFQSTLPPLHWTREDRYSAMVRFGFFAGCRNCYSALSSGTTIIVNRAQSADGLVREIQDKRVTVSVITPVHLRMLLKYAVGRPPIFPLIRSLRVATGAITKGERALARKHITPNIILVYGCNELSWVSIATPEDQDAEPDAVGRPVEGVEAQIVDDDDRPLPPGEVGLIRFRAAHAATEYMNNPEATARAFRDGWLYPLDLAAMNEDGYIFLKGRADDRISVDGIKFYPIEVEAVLRDHPAVTDAAVFGWPDPVHGEIPIAAVTTSEAVKKQTLAAFCMEQLASYKIPRDILIVPEMPRNPMGKIVKAELKQNLADRLRQRSPAPGPRPLG